MRSGALTVAAGAGIIAWTVTLELPWILLWIPGALLLMRGVSALMDEHARRRALRRRRGRRGYLR